MTRELLATLVLAACCASVSFASPGEVRVPRDVARESSPPPFARTCVVSFDELSPVDASCPLPSYSEAWDGPVLLASNSSHRTIWVSYLYDDVDGRRYHGRCYELPARSTRAIPDQAMRPASDRRVHVSVLPGPGFPSSGFAISCRAVRQVVTD